MGPDSDGAVSMTTGAGSGGPSVSDGKPDDPIYGVVDYLDSANGTEEDQNNAISILDRIGDKRAVPYLIPKLESPPTRRNRCSTRTRRIRPWVSRGMSATSSM